MSNGRSIINDVFIGFRIIQNVNPLVKLSCYYFMSKSIFSPITSVDRQAILNTTQFVNGS